MRIKITCDIGEGIRLQSTTTTFSLVLSTVFSGNPTPNMQIFSTKTAMNWKIGVSSCLPSPN